ncbi:prepilin-type N-terminal cleavage/methylation domain-containing protein [Bacillus sp. DNRA2]|uniref:prepilin-type N-terminal cleavage/methylation domain-containing protein n=1 Tax=Bacillus sp. DNRA2 TaxID=2723053 RepID=UPI00145D8097|nr:prepilin-type N-terminal cleavage/methylation domain-containing protein [Bacillus sp. DNRA2]NMD70524.1 prepilin-type N-terminal cleavage/methylation domain-containing protein [Bacillus sp. DNRA2]
MIKNNRGMTLVELLSVLALLSMVLLLANSVQLFSQKQVTKQVDDIEKQTNIRIAISTLTKEIRSANTVTVQNNVLTVNSDIYQLVGNTLQKNNQSFVSKIKKFEVSKDANKITLLLEGQSTNNQNPVVRTTTIYIRE